MVIKKAKKIFSILAAVLVAFSGCSSGSGHSASTNKEFLQKTDIPTGRYIEKEITPSATFLKEGTKNPYSLGVYPDGKGAIYYLATVNHISGTERPEIIYCRSLDNGETWEALSDRWYKQLYEQYGSENDTLLAAAAFGKDNILYCILNVDNNRNKLVKIKEDQIEEIPMEGWDQDEFYNSRQGFFVQGFQVLSNNDIAISFDMLDTYSFIYDGTTGKQKEEIPTQNAAVYFGKERYGMVNYDSALHGNAIMAYDYDGTEKIKQPVDTEFAEETFLSGGTDEIFLVDKTGVYSFAEGEPESRCIMEPDSYTFGSPSWYVKQFTYDTATKAFYMILKQHGKGNEKLFRYEFDPSAPAYAAETLTVFTLQDSDTLRQGISVFQRLHPEFKVEVEVGLTDDSSATQDDIIRVLNTELLAKKGPDILILDGLPIGSYIEKGILTDLSDLVNSDNLFSNLAQSYASEKGVYAIPVRCSIPVLCGEKGWADSLTSLSEIAEQAQKAPSLPEQLPERNDRLPKEKRPLSFIASYWDTVKLFYPTYSPKLVKEDQSLNIELLRELLSQSKILFKRYNTLDGSDFLGAGLSMSDVLSFLPRDLYGEHTLLGITILRDFGDCLTYSRYAPQTTEGKLKSAPLYFLPLCGPEKNVFIPNCIASVNISSPKQEAAKEFIQTMLEEEVQEPAYSEGFPVNKTAFQTCYEESKTRWSVNYQTDMEQLTTSLTTPAANDQMVLEAILEEVKPYYDDTETLEEAITHITAKLQTYLAEKA